MSHLPAGTDSINGQECDSSLEVRLHGTDADYEWVGYEAAYPVTWMPGVVTVVAAAPAA